MLAMETIGALGRPEEEETRMLALQSHSLGIDPDVADVIRVQKAINAAARSVFAASGQTGNLFVGPEGGLFNRDNLAVAQGVARGVLQNVALQRTLTALEATGQASDVRKTLSFIMTADFKTVDDKLDDVASDVAAVFEFVASGFAEKKKKAGMSTGAKVALGVGGAVVVVGGAFLALRGRGGMSGAPMRARRRRLAGAW